MANYDYYKIMNGIKRSVRAAVLGLLYLVVFAWFRSHDVWNVSAKVTTTDMLVWTTLRLLFVACLGVACLTAGKIVLMGQGKSLRDFGVLEQMLFYFFVGSAVLRMGMFFIGIFGFYQPLFVFLVSLPLICLFPFVFDIRLIGCQRAEGVPRNVWENIYVGGLWLIAVVILGVIYVGHCQYSFDGDYLTHYGPYYDHVIRSGSLAPNEVWYQYFYSRGAGLFYLAMMITDRTGPLLVSFLHFAAAMLLVYTVIKRASGSSLWAISAAIFMLGMMAWPNEGFFIKHHCEVSAIILSIVCAVVLMTASKRHGALFLIVAGILQTSLLLYSFQAGVYTLMFIGVYAALSLYRRNLGLMRRYAAILIVAGIVSVLSMVYNYSVTGLYEITPYRVFLHFWNQEIFSKWVSPYLMFYVSEGSSAEFGTIGISGVFHDVLMYARLFRLEKFFFSWVFWIVSGLVGVLGFWGASQRTSSGGTWGFELPGMSAVRENILRWVMLPSFIMCLLVFFVYVFIQQSISILRLSEFASMYVTMFIYSFLIACSSLIPRFAVYRATSVLVPVLLAFAACSWTIDHGRGGKVKTPLKFALGMLSANELAPVEKIVSAQYSRIRAIAGENSRIASFNLSADYGPLFLQYPGIMTEVSCAFGNRWHDIVFGDPDAAKKTLQELGINYFLVDLGSPMFGAFPYSPLFTGQSLATNFRIAWQLGSRFLLTWNDGQQSLDDKFLQEWGRCLQRGMPSTLKGTADYGKSLYDRVLYLYKLNHHSLHGIVRPDNLQRVEGWQ